MRTSSNQFFGYVWSWGGIEEWAGVVDLGKDEGFFMIERSLKMNRQIKNQFEPKMIIFYKKASQVVIKF